MLRYLKNVGQYIAKKMAEDGYEVIGIYREKKPRDASYQLICADLAKEVLEIEEVNAIIHIATRLSGSTSQLIHDNIYAMENLIQFAERAKVQKFIYMSSVSVYGSVEGTLSEKSDRMNPEQYGMTKYLSECLLRESAIPQKLILQLPRMLGPFVDLEHVEGSGFLMMTKKILNGEKVECFIPNAKYNNYLHVSELGEFIEHMLKEQIWTETKTLLLGANERLTMLEILQTMKEVSGSNSEIVLQDNPGKKPKCALIDIEQAKKCGFAPVAASEMLKKFVLDDCIV